MSVQKDDIVKVKMANDNQARRARVMNTHKDGTADIYLMEGPYKGATHRVRQSGLKRTGEKYQQPVPQPHGFDSKEQYRDVTRALSDFARRYGGSAAMAGSSVTGESFLEKILFGSHSDHDHQILIPSEGREKLITDGQIHGSGPNKGFPRAGSELDNIQKRLSNAAGRKASVKVHVGVPKHGKDTRPTYVRSNTPTPPTPKNGSPGTSGDIRNGNGRKNGNGNGKKNGNGNGKKNGNGKNGRPPVHPRNNGKKNGNGEKENAMQKAAREATTAINNAGTRLDAHNAYNRGQQRLQDAFNTMDVTRYITQFQNLSARLTQAYTNKVNSLNRPTNPRTRR